MNKTNEEITIKGTVTQIVYDHGKRNQLFKYKYNRKRKMNFGNNNIVDNIQP